MAGAACIGLAAIAARHVLPVQSAPQRLPPVVAALPPAVAEHAPISGYITQLDLLVSNCSSPVYVIASVSVRSEYFEVEQASRRRLPSPALFGLAIGDPSIQITQLPNQRGREPWWSFKYGATHVFTGKYEGVVMATRVKNDPPRPMVISFTFTAPWLYPRSYHSCWLSVPELVGPEASEAAEQSSWPLNARLGADSGAAPLRAKAASRTSGVGSVTIHESYTKEYASTSTPAAEGSDELSTRLDVLTSDIRGPEPSLGTPTWRCLGPHQNTTWDRDGESRPRGCGAWIALEEPGAQLRYDIWLLLAGAILSVGLALLVDALLGMRRPKSTLA